MRYRLTSSPQRARAQVLTPPHLAARLIDFLQGDQESWLELGVGDGRIAKACLDARRPARYVGVDVDERLLSKAPHVAALELHRGDVLRPRELSGLLDEELFSRVAGNPPYGMQAAAIACQERLDELCPGIPPVNRWIQLDLYFMLESLARLRRPGEAAFIVGAPIAEDARLSSFRRALVSAASEVECYELPAFVFENKAEVQSYLLVARFGSSRLKKVKVARLSGPDLASVDGRWVTPEQAALRMDLGHYEFEAWNLALQTKPGVRTLSELGANVVRGSRTRTQFDELDIECFHTTDFPLFGTELRFGRGADHGFQSATAGDILLPRVGTRCLDRQAMVIKGKRHFTEAVYRLRVPAHNHAAVANWVLSESGARWRQAAAKGSCAKHLTVTSLMAMPVPAA